MLGFIVGFAFGILQLYFLKKIAIEGIMAKKPTKQVIPFILLKLLSYVIGIIICLFLWRKAILYIGLGFGAGLIASAFFAFSKMTTGKGR